MFNKSIVRCICIAALVAVGSAADAQQPPQPSASAIATAKQIVLAKGATAMLDPLLPAIIERAKVQLLQTNPMLSKDFNEVAAKLRVDYAPQQQQLINETERLYATHFTEAELKEMLAFYQSPVGKKMIVEEPRVLDQTMRYADNWAKKIEDEIIGKFRIEMKKRGHDI